MGNLHCLSIWPQVSSPKLLTNRTESFFRSKQFTQPVKKFPAFYGIWWFITMFTWACHWSISEVTPIQFTPSHALSLSLKSILLLSFHLCLCLLSCLFCLCFPNKNLYAFLISHMPNPFQSPWLYHPNNKCWRVQFKKLLIMQCSPAPTTSSLLCPNMLVIILFRIFCLPIFSLET